MYSTVFTAMTLTKDRALTRERHFLHPCFHRPALRRSETHLKGLGDYLAGATREGVVHEVEFISVYVRLQPCMLRVSPISLHVVLTGTNLIQDARHLYARLSILHFAITSSWKSSGTPLSRSPSHTAFADRFEMISRGSSGLFHEWSRRGCRQW